MAMVKSPDNVIEIYAERRFFGRQYHLSAGAGLALHNHTEADIHMTVMQAGRVKISGPNIAPVEISAPGIFNFVAGSPHEIEALVDGTVIYNPLKNPA
jgi:hypothetical protein